MNARSSSRIFFDYIKNQNLRCIAICSMLNTIFMAALFTPCRIWAVDSFSPSGVSTVQTAHYPAINLPTEHIFVPQLPGESQEKRGLAWIDNDRLIFTGGQAGRPESKGLYIWDVSANTVSQYSSHTQFCFADGYIVAQQVLDYPNASTIRPIRYGPIGKEANDNCDISTKKGCHGTLNMGCKPRRYLGRPTIGGDSSFSVELRTNDGVIVDPIYHERDIRNLPSTIEEQKKRFSRPLLLINKRYPLGKPLPITALEEIRNSAYSPFVNRYVFLTDRPIDGQPGLTTIWPKGRSQPVYLMDTNGDVETIQIPSYPDWSKIDLALPALPGLAFIGSGGYANEWGGLFLYDKRNVYVLDRGKVDTLATSHDGCKVAYAIVNEYGKTSKNLLRVKLIRLCKGEK